MNFSSILLFLFLSLFFLISSIDSYSYILSSSYNLSKNRNSLYSIKKSSTLLNESDKILPSKKLKKIINIKTNNNNLINKKKKQKKVKEVKKEEKEEDKDLNNKKIKRFKFDRDVPQYEPVPIFLDNHLNPLSSPLSNSFSSPLTSTLSSAHSTSLSSSSSSSLLLPSSSLSSFTSFSSGSFILKMFGDPIALARHRMTRRGMMYNPSGKAQKAFAEKFTEIFPFLSSNSNEFNSSILSSTSDSSIIISNTTSISSFLLNGPLQANFVFAFQRPKSHYKQSKKQKILKDVYKSSWHQQRKGIIYIYIYTYISFLYILFFLLFIIYFYFFLFF